jgi:uncharacterized protein
MISLDKNAIADFCRRWKIQEFSIFGSSIRGDFTPQSDVDILVSFHPDKRQTLEERLQMTENFKKDVAFFFKQPDLLTFHF